MGPLNDTNNKQADYHITIVNAFDSQMFTLFLKYVSIELKVTFSTKV